MNKPLSGFAALNVENSHLYVIGGNDGRVQSRVERLNLQSLEWEKMPKMHMKRDELAACIGPDGCIYAVGGYGGGDNSSLASVERLDLTTNEW